MANYLEQLTREWYEYQGYFVRQNVLVGKRPKGGHECELDVVAFHPVKKHLVHVEPSMDAQSWAKREARYKKKFDAGKKYIPALFKGLEIPNKIEQIALFVFASTKNRQSVGGGRIMTVDQFLYDAMKEISKRGMTKAQVSEQLPILRTLQFVFHYRQRISQAWEPAKD